MGSGHLTLWTRAGLALVAAESIAHAAGGLQFFPRLISIPERGEVTGYVLVVGADRFSFIPPQGWQLKYNANQRAIVLTPPDYAASLTVRILPADPAMATDSPAEAIEQKLLKRFPGAKVVDTQPCCLSGMEGLAFDLERTTSQGTVLATRVCCIPFPGGQVEFCLATTPGKLKESDVSLNVLMTSFEIEAANAGQEPPPLALK